MSQVRMSVGRHLEPTRFRVLVADDFEPWRDYACSALKKYDSAFSVHQTSDGLETVLKAHDLQPDLILLDISLPKMHGIEAARQIRVQCPKAKILFVSEDRSLDVVREALNTGAQGYVVKSDGVELLAAVEAVRQGRFFVSKSLAEHPLGAADLDPSSR
jgi:DNA-binding NarL/FixJ family response regulator